MRAMKRCARAMLNGYGRSKAARASGPRRRRQANRIQRRRLGAGRSWDGAPPSARLAPASPVLRLLEMATRSLGTATRDWFVI
jgi:hypothetical protein